jgi:DNA-directed RNA polymerase specialized sigma24 family protein
MLSQLREIQERKYGKVYLEENSNLNRLYSIFSTLSSKYGVNYNDIIDLIKSRKNYASVPIKIFNNNLSPLENVVLYLTIRFNLTQTEIANILKRDHTTIWTTLMNAQKKAKKMKYFEDISRLESEKEKILVPVQVLADEKLSILESMSLYMKEGRNMSLHEIALALGRDDRTIWTCVRRARKKLEMPKEIRK